VSAAVDSPLLGWGTPSEDEANEPLNVSSIAYNNFLHVKHGPGRLYGFTVYSSNASAQFIQVFDSSRKPNNGEIPAAVFTVSGVSNLPIQWFPWRTFLSGCWILNSTTGPTLTAGAADTWFDAQFL
jgi:hypothetical protein